MNNLPHYAAIGAAVLLAIGSQVLLKIGASRTKSSLNATTLTGVITFGVVTILMVFALQGIYLRTAIAITALALVGIPLAAKVFLGEQMTRRVVFGSIVIVIGIVVLLAGG